MGESLEISPLVQILLCWREVEDCVSVGALVRLGRGDVTHSLEPPDQRKGVDAPVAPVTSG